jgi:hypothetical protein
MTDVIVALLHTIAASEVDIPLFRAHGFGLIVLLLLIVMRRRRDE